MKTISFREDMIDLILAGKKTLTIRPIKPQPERVELTGLFGTKHYEWNGLQLVGMRDWFMRHCPYGIVGDVISVWENDQLRLKITAVDVTSFGLVTIPEWEADGVEIVDLAVWSGTVSHHWQSFYEGTDYDHQNWPWVWVIRFEIQP